MTIGEHESTSPSQPTLEQSLDEALGEDRPEADEVVSKEPVAHLAVVGGPETGRLIRLGAGEIILGRSDAASGKLHDPSTSQRHAKVFWHDGTYVLVDLGSTNGTYLNDERIEGPVVLTHRDKVRIGRTILRFLSKDHRHIPNETVPLEPMVEPPDPPRRDLVRYRDARLTPWGPRDLAGYGPAAGAPVDWVTYLRLGLDYTKRYARFVALLTAIGLAAGATHGLTKPPHGSAFFEITLSKDARTNPVEKDDATAFFVAAERYFTSTGLIKETLKRLGVAPTEQAALAVQRRMKFIALDKQERVWRGEYRGRDAESARLFLSHHLDVYLGRELDKTLHVLRAQVQLLEEQVERSGEELRQTEGELAAFKKEHPGVVGSEDTEQYASLAPLQARRDDLNAQVKRLKLELNLNRQRLQSGDALLRGRVSSASSYSSALQDIEKQISEAKARGLGEQHPTLKRLHAQASELRQLRDSTINADSSDIERRSNEGYVAVRERVRDLEVALKVAEAELGQVNERLTSTEGRLSDLPAAEAQLARLTRNYASTKELHDKLYQKLKAGRIQLEIEQASARARYDLLTPPTPERPNMMMTVVQRSAIGAVGMFFMAVLCAAARETLRYLRSVL